MPACSSTGYTLLPSVVYGLITRVTFCSTALRAHCAATFGSLLVLQTTTCTLCLVPDASARPPALLIALARACTPPATSGFFEPSAATSNSPSVITLIGAPV